MPHSYDDIFDMIMSHDVDDGRDHLILMNRRTSADIKKIVGPDGLLLWKYLPDRILDVRVRIDESIPPQEIHLESTDKLDITILISDQIN